MRRVTVVATGIANTASVVAALERLGAHAEVTDDAGRLRDAGPVVLPGVGAFGAGMNRLRGRNVDGEIASRVRGGQAVLAVCLGMQMLCACSEETPGVAGLGVVDAPVRAFPPEVRTPQFGWNRVEADDKCRIITTGDAYFANSYRVTRPPRGWASATATHGGPFVAALERGPVLLCQFHPELSGAWGLELLDRWRRVAEEAA